MKCPRCGNEVSQEEAFCGQCGAPNTPPANPTEMVSIPSPQSGRLGTQYPGFPFTSAQPQTSHPGPHTPSRTNIPPSSSFISQQKPVQNRQTGFYQDATEAMSVLPGTPEQAYHTGYQQGFPTVSAPGNYPGSGQFSPQTQQAFQAGNYPGPMSPPSQSFPTGQNYDYGAFRTPPPAKRSSASLIVVICVCLVVALLVGVGAAGLFAMRSQPSGQATATAIPSPTATLAPTPSPSPTAAETATPTLPPSPTVVPTAAPDPNFTWCTDTCRANGFLVEYPNGWQMGQAVNAAGVQFTNPAQGDQYASFKAAGPTTGSANDLVNVDLQANFASKPGYTAPTTTSSMTISGETWVTAIAYYLSDTQQKERVEVLASVHQGKGYITELQAPDSQFDAVYAQLFTPMLNRYQFSQ